MTCSKCNGENVTISTVQTQGVSKTNNSGCLWTIGRWLLIICTCGLWLVIGKKKERTSISFKSERRALCQTCGHEWKIK